MVLSKSSITTQRSRKTYQSPLPWGALETAVNTISHEYLLDFTSEYGIPKTLHPALPGLEDRIVDFPEELEQSLLLGRREGILDRRGLTDEFPQGRDAGYGHILHRGRTGAGYASYSHPKTNGDAAVFSRDKSTNCRSLTADMDLFNLIRTPNPTKLKTGSRPRAPHEVPLLTLTAPRIIEMDEPAATDSSGVPSTIERSPLDFAHEAGASDQGVAAPEMPSSEDVPATAALGQARLKRLPRWILLRPQKSVKEATMGPILAAIQLGLASTVVVPEDAPMGVSDPDPLSFADAPSRHPVDIAQSSGSVYQPEWGVTNGSLLDTPEAYQDLVDHVAPSGYFSELRHMHNEEFLRRYNVNLARRVAMGSQLRLRFEQEAKLLRKRQECWVKSRIGKNACPVLRSSGKHERLSHQVATLQQQVSGEEKLKAAFEEFKRQQDERVEQRCAEMDARLDALSIDFDEELYPHMLTAIAGHQWVIGRRLSLAVMKCDESLELRQAFANAVSAGIAKGLSEGLRHGLEHGQAQRSLEFIEAYDLEAEAKFVAALQALKDLKYPLVDQLEGLRDAPMDVIMVALYLESDTGDDASQDIRDLHPSSSQLTIPVYPEVRDPRNPWACKEEIGLADAIAANISRAEKKKRCRIGFALLLADVTTQTESDDT
uniref:Putative transposase (Putative), gypsy type n=1 Tax=Tanacetum cinerariifolium TaxID=118510 RepID=A0A6L2MGA2_TANCI|nr:putative transposase (putative), gypsy type [Tanacetum cinerariifolium]